MTACARLLCDNCKRPGACCCGFDINHSDLNSLQTPLEVMVEMATRGLPFMPLLRRTAGIPNAEWAVWRFWCPILDLQTGRCGDYANRPALCRTYESGSDRLCSMWNEPEHIRKG